MRSLTPPTAAVPKPPATPRLAAPDILPAQLLKPPGGVQALAKLTQWTKGGVGIAGEEADLVQTEKLIQSLPSRVNALRSGGITKQMAQQWSDFYIQEAAANPVTQPPANQTPSALDTDASNCRFVMSYGGNRMDIPVRNSCSKDIVLGLEPEGDTVSLSPGKTVTIRTIDSVSDITEFGIEVEESLVSVTIMARKEVWSGDKRLR